MFKKKNKLKRTRIIPKLILLSFIIIASVQTISALVIFSAPEFSQAAIELKPNTPIGDDKPIVFNTGNTQPIADYVATVYEYAIGVVGIVAAVMMMIGGLIWLTAGGNATQVSKAKSYIGASLGGLVLALGSYLILAQVNPALVDPTISTITAINSGIEQKVGDDNIYDCRYEFTTSPLDPPEIYPGNGGMLFPDANCNDRGKVKETKTDKCYCYYNSLDDHEWRAGAECTPNEKKYADNIEDGIPFCGSEIGNGEICCGPKIPKECGSITNCRNITGTGVLATTYSNKIQCKDNNSCKVTERLAYNLGRLYDSLNPEKNFIVSEAWPPTREHKNICHSNGECIDLSSWNLSPEEQVKLVEQAPAVGLRAVYECKETGCCEDWQSGSHDAGDCDELGDWISAPHFSVYLD